MTYNTGAIDYGERVGKKFLGTYTGDSVASVEKDIYDARMMIETTADPVQRMLIKRDINVGFAGELASNGLASKNPIID